MMMAFFDLAGSDGGNRAQELAVGIVTALSTTALGLAICAFALATIVQEYVRGLRARRATTGEGYLAAMGNLWRRNGRRYGGYIVHLGIVCIGVAIIGPTIGAIATGR